MIQKHAELTVDVHKEFKGGKGRISMEHFLDPRNSGGAGRLFCKIVIPPGASLGIHRHEGECELVYILKGEALVNDNGTEVKLGPGDVNFCRDGEMHGIENIGAGDLESVAIVLFTGRREV
jgi:quercetin dioxygenase-like cupin family protein